jgi:hypothetical protein
MRRNDEMVVGDMSLFYLRAGGSKKPSDESRTSPQNDRANFTVLKDYRNVSPMVASHGWWKFEGGVIS